MNDLNIETEGAALIGDMLENGLLLAIHHSDGEIGEIELDKHQVYKLFAFLRDYLADVAAEDED